MKISKFSGLTQTSPQFLVSLGMISLLLASASLRIHGTATASLFVDEVSSVERATAHSWSDAYTLLLEAHHAPLYDTVILAQWMRIGSSELILKYLTVLIGTVNIALVYALGKSTDDNRVALLGAAICCVSPLHITHSKETRMYVFAALFLTAAIYCLVQAIKRPNRIVFWCGYVICGVLSLYTHYYTGFALLSVNLTMLGIALFRRDWRLTRLTLLSGLIIGLLFSPWLPTFLNQANSGPVPWIKPLTTGRLIRILAAFLFTEWRLGPLFPFAVGIALLTVGLALIDARRNQTCVVERSDSYGICLIAVAYLGTIAISIAISLFRPFLTDRYLIFTTPLAALTLARLVVRSTNRHIMVALATVLVLLVSISGLTTALNPLYEDWKGVSAYLSERMDEHDLILYSSWLSQSPVEYYLQRQIPSVDLVSVTEPTPQLDLSTIEQIWLVHCNRYEVDSDHLEWIRSLMNRRDSNCVEMGDRHYAVTICLLSVKDTM